MFFFRGPPPPPYLTDLSLQNYRPQVGSTAQCLGRPLAPGGPSNEESLGGDQKVGVLESFLAAAQKTVDNVGALPSHFFSLPFFSDKV